MLIEVTLNLHDPSDLTVLQPALDEIKRRAAERDRAYYDAVNGSAEAAEPDAHTLAAPVVEAIIEEGIAGLTAARPGDVLPLVSGVAYVGTPAEPQADGATVPSSTATLEELKSAFYAFINAKGAAAAIELLGRYGVKRVDELTPEQRYTVLQEAR